MKEKKRMGAGELIKNHVQGTCSEMKERKGEMGLAASGLGRGEESTTVGLAQRNKTRRKKRRERVGKASWFSSRLRNEGREGGCVRMG